MNFFKKKEKPVEVKQKCPAEGCEFIADDKWDLKRHIEWKHPELKGKVDLPAGKKG